VTQMANPLNRQLGGRDAQGLSYRDAFPELDRQGFTRLLDGVRETGEPFMGRETLIQLEASGEEPARDMYLDFTYQPVRGPEGGIEGILTLAREVTEQVLARRAAQRLAEEERRLRDFEQHLIGIVSHDLRNPLGAILLGLQLLLRRGEQDTRTRQALRRLESSTERAVRMVRDLLDFTQARLGGLKMKRASVNLHDVVRSVVEELQVTYPERELSLEQSGEGRGDWDGDRLAQLVGNLVSNALKYSPVDSPVTVHATGGSEEVRLEVRNRGLPISPEALSRLFQPMQRGREEMDNATRSVGLGLYIVDQIARAHGGDVQVTSSLTEGTCFRVRLPRAS
ncbi:MAG: ATP-binding protein, partial [Cystobacter sp.]